ncbi:murein-DD-endopeptidase [Klebsiella michiganensis]|nr:murein-DD-endopeptidase [Klebsiella michiganensis]
MFTMTKFRVSLLSLTLLLAVPFAPQALAKTSTAVTASQPDIASGSAMIVDLASKKIIYASQPDLVRPDGVDHQGDDRDGGA